MKIIREIWKVGLVDWLWFVIYLGRNEFSHRLCLLRYVKSPGDSDGLTRLIRDRDRAHRIDLELSNI